MFFGSYEYSIDEKGRLVIPSKFRSEVGNKLYLLKGFDGCISVYKESDFQKYIDRLEHLEFEREKVRLHQRILLSSVVELDVDKTGRMLIPTKKLKEYSIGKNVTIIGALDHFEIWDLQAWTKYVQDHEKDFEKDAEAILKDEE
jgi:MraZ protein